MFLNSLYNSVICIIKIYFFFFIYLFAVRLRQISPFRKYLPWRFEYLFMKKLFQKSHSYFYLLSIPEILVG